MKEAVELLKKMMEPLGSSEDVRLFRLDYRDSKTGIDYYRNYVSMTSPGRSREAIVKDFEKEVARAGYKLTGLYEVKAGHTSEEVEALAEVDMEAARRLIVWGYLAGDDFNVKQQKQRRKKKTGRK